MNKENRNALLSDIYDFQYGMGNTIEDIGGDYPIYGSNGAVGFTNIFNSEDAPVIGHIGAYAGIVNWASGKHFVTYNGVICRIKKGIHPRFGYYLLLHSKLQKRLRGSTQPFVSYDLLYEVKVFLPDTKTQNNIASVLTALDSKIELNKRINAELEAMAKPLYDYWFVQFDFPNENGKPYKTSGGSLVWNEELKREIPEGWEVKEIGEVAIVKAGGDKPENYTIEKTKTNNVPIYSNGITNNGLYGYTSKSIINEQSITISARGTIGFCVLRNKPFVPIIRLISLIPNLKGSAKYFYEALKNFIFENSGSVQQQLTVPQVTRIKILYPNEDILKKYDEVTSPMIERVEIIQKENQKLIELRDWLLPMLMNGQVKVN